MHLAKQTMWVLAVGGIAGAVVGAARGFPGLAQAADAAATCTGPVPTHPMISWIALAEAKAALDRGEATFVDARSHDVFVAGHIAGALNVPMNGGTPPTDVVALLRTAPILVTYCDTSASCAASTRLARDLVQAGLTNVRVLEGGFPSWIGAGHPAEAGDCPLCPAAGDCPVCPRQ